MYSGNRFKVVFVGLLLFLLVVFPGVVWATALSITTTALPAATRHVYYNENLIASGGDGSYSWSLYSGSLPPGLTLSGGGVVEGIPTSIGSHSFTVRVIDGANVVVTKTITLQVLEATGPVVTTSTLPVAQLGVGYNTTLTATHGTGTYTWSLHSGTLPPGLTINASGTISGTPTTAGTYPITVSVQDGQGRTSHKNLSLFVESLFITTAELPDATMLGMYREPLFALGGVGSYSWTLASGRLPTGLTLLSEGIIAGMPTVRGTFNFSLRVRDGSNRSVTKSFSMRVTDRGRVSIVTEDLPVVPPGLPVFFELEAQGGDSPYSWSLLRGALPRALTLHNNGTLSGTPQTEGKYTFTVQVVDQLGLFREKEYVLEVGDPTPVPAPPVALPPGDGIIRIYVNGERLLTDTAPFLRESKTFVPLRSVFEKLGAQVIWNGDLRQITIKRRTTELVMQVGNRNGWLNGRPVILDAAPIMSNGRVMVPLRVVGEALGVQVNWDQATRHVNIKF